jgi:hypothetical protein
MAARKSITKALNNVIPITCHPKFSVKSSRLEEPTDDEIFQMAISGGIRFGVASVEEDEAS